jgi:hypothetical protein
MICVIALVLAMPNKPPILLSNWHLSSLGGEITVDLKMKMSYFSQNP